MIPTVRTAFLAALLAFPFAATAYQKVADTENILDDCTACPRLYTNFYKCQQTGQADAKSCVCVNGNDGWFSQIDACTTCLGRSSDNVIWPVFTSVAWSLYGACRSSLRITSTGNSLCVSGLAGGKDEPWDGCISVRDKSEGLTWASWKLISFPGFDGRSNFTAAVSLAALNGDGETSTNAAPSPSTSAASGTSTDAESTTTTSTRPTVEADRTDASTSSISGADATSASAASSTTGPDTSSSGTDTTTAAATTPTGAAARLGGGVAGCALGMAMLSTFGWLI
jgi:hypothetical protein